MKKLSILILLLSPVSFVCGQTSQLSIKQIDSVVYSIDTTKEVQNAVADGTLRPKGKRKPKGGFSDTYLLSAKTHKLIKVEQGQSLFFTDYSTYYFFNDSLIFVKTSRCNLSGDTTNKISSGQYYFVNDILVDKKEKGKPASRPDVFTNHAKQYLIDVKNVFSL